MSYLVSVVVPTKNRYKYLKYLIQLIDSFKLPELEFVIQDNSDDNTEIVEYLKAYPSPDIKYYYSNEPLTMSGNGELAIKNSTGEYVCYIGDDDGVCRNIVDWVKWMKENNVKAIYNQNNVFYRWGGKAKVMAPYKGIIKHNSSKEIDKLLRRGMCLAKTSLPMLYHGIVRRDVLDGIIQKIGTLFPSVPPDISGSICLAYNIDEYYEIRTPIIINGASAMTGGGVIQQGGVLALSDVPFINEKDIEEWEPSIPPLWCGNYAWAESGIKTLKKLGKDEKLKGFDVDYCLATAVALRPNKSLLRKMGWKYSKNKIRYLLFVVALIFDKYYVKLKNNIPFLVKQSKNKRTIVDAELFFTNTCK